ncbi:hypothetical protein LTR56_026734 [Elasticomyces elasticus]|nr:hypothetical protein LTR56_026734 [Elasticomyces elasticus]
MALKGPKYFQEHGVANRLEKRALLIAVNCVAALSIFFFGVMGGVNTARNYGNTKLMGFGHFEEADGLVKVDRPLLQGGIVAVYYLPGTLVGALWGGWLGDRYGRIATIGIASILQEWIGIAGITIYGPEIFTIAGIAAADRQWVSGLNNVTYMFATLICVFTLDRIGRRWTLYWGAVGQGICCFCAGGLSYATQIATGSHKTHVGGAAVFFVYLYTAIFGATWLTVPWLYPAEIFPLQVRAKGNAWGVVGWSIGNGWCVLLLPTIFAALNEKTLYIFGGVNVLSILVVWALYPETNQRTLEEMNLVFASDSIWNWEAEKNFARLAEQNPNLVQAARAGSLTIDPETGLTAVGHKQSGERPVSLIAEKQV